jgi:hypothetical protein
LDKKPVSIQELNQLMIFSRQLSSVHVESIKSYPFIFFNGLTEVKVDHDISLVVDGPSLVSYDLTLKEENDHLEKRYKALESALRSLFWKELKIKVSINSQEAYKSE